MKAKECLAEGHSSNDNLRELTSIRPVLEEDGLPVMTNGNFAVVFKMKDEEAGGRYSNE